MSANAAVGSDGAVRARVARYMEPFAEAFSAARLLPRLLTHLTQSEELTQALSVELRAMHAEGRRADVDDDGTEEDARMFVWDLEAADCPPFRVSRALLNFGRIGFVKGSMMPPAAA